MVTLKVLDVSENEISNLEKIDFADLKNLKYLSLSGNAGILSLFVPLHRLLCGKGKNIEHLDISYTDLSHIDDNAFVCDDNPVSHLRYIDISHEEIRIEKNSFASLNQLEYLGSNDRLICCVYFIQFPYSRVTCDAPEDIFSSCSDLLSSVLLRVSLWLLCMTSLIGNTFVIIYRLVFEKRTSALGYHVFVMSLSVSDLLMGVYLVIIGSADLSYRGQFLWQRWDWKSHPMCTLSGVVGLVSSEVSAFSILLIMLDRLIAIKFPLHRHLHFTPSSALMVVAFSWLAGLILSFVPLMPFFSHWQFYQQNAICLPLPITNKVFPGQNYTRSIFLILNFIIFMLIALGQGVIYISVQNSSRISSTVSTKDVAIARRLFTVVFSDFCCWFPVGVMGLMANAGVPIPGEVNVWTAVFILPLNSALNPFLYTFSKWRQKREEIKNKRRYEAFVKRYKALQRV